jgi:hypothetical protein
MNNSSNTRDNKVSMVNTRSNIDNISLLAITGNTNAQKFEIDNSKNRSKYTRNNINVIFHNMHLRTAAEVSIYYYFRHRECILKIQMKTNIKRSRKTVHTNNKYCYNRDTVHRVLQTAKKLNNPKQDCCYSSRTHLKKRRNVINRNFIDSNWMTHTCQSTTEDNQPNTKKSNGAEDIETEDNEYDITENNKLQEIMDHIFSQMAESKLSKPTENSEDEGATEETGEIEYNKQENKILQDIMDYITNETKSTLLKEISEAETEYNKKENKILQDIIDYSTKDTESTLVTEISKAETEYNKKENKRFRDIIDYSTEDTETTLLTESSKAEQGPEDNDNSTNKYKNLDVDGYKKQQAQKSQENRHKPLRQQTKPQRQKNHPAKAKRTMLKIKIKTACLRKQEYKERIYWYKCSKKFSSKHKEYRQDKSKKVRKEYLRPP